MIGRRQFIAQTIGAIVIAPLAAAGITQFVPKPPVQDLHDYLSKLYELARRQQQSEIDIYVDNETADKLRKMAARYQHYSQDHQTRWHRRFDRVDAEFSAARTRADYYRLRREIRVMWRTISC